MTWLSSPDDREPTLLLAEAFTVENGGLPAAVSFDGVESTEDGEDGGLMVEPLDGSKVSFWVGESVLGLVWGVDGRENVGRDVSPGLNLEVGFAVTVSIDCGGLAEEDGSTSEEDNDGEALNPTCTGRRLRLSTVGGIDVEGIALGEEEEEFCRAVCILSDSARAEIISFIGIAFRGFLMEWSFSSLCVMSVALLPAAR